MSRNLTMVSVNLDDVLGFHTLGIKVVEVGGCKVRIVGKKVRPRARRSGLNNFLELQCLVPLDYWKSEAKTSCSSIPLESSHCQNIGWNVEIYVE